MSEILRRIVRAENLILGHLQTMERRIMSALEDLQAAEAANEVQVQAVVAEVQTLVTQLANTAPDDTDALHVLTAKIMASTNALANSIPSPTANTAAKVASGQVTSQTDGGVTTDPITGGLVADPSIPPQGT